MYFPHNTPPMIARRSQLCADTRQRPSPWLNLQLAFMLDVFNHSKQQQERIDRGERVDYDK